MEFDHELISKPEVIECTYQKGAYIFRQGEEVEFVYYLVTGTACRTSLSQEGEEIIYTYWKGHEFLGAFPLINNHIYTENNIIAKTICQGYKIPKDIFLEFIDENPKALKQLLIRAIHEMNSIVDNGLYMRQGKMGNRVCQILLDWAEERDGVYRIDKVVSYVELSKFLGVHPVTISRIVKQLKREKVIDSTKQGVIVLDPDRLRRYSLGEKIHYR